MKLSASLIKQHEKNENFLHSEVQRTFCHRDNGNRKDYRAWVSACATLRAYQSPIANLWSPEFKKAALSGERTSIEAILTYLEVNPSYFRSGYLKERLTRIIKQAPRTENDNVRLRNVIWIQAAGPNRREFGHFCRLARAVSTPDFKKLVSSASPELQHRSKGKFNYLLNYL